MKKRIAVIFLFLLFGSIQIAIYTTPVKPEEIILSKHVLNVHSNLNPVMIYTLYSDKWELSFVGSGTMFGPTNHLRVLTAAHIFNERKKEPYFLVKKLGSTNNGTSAFCFITAICPESESLHYRSAGNDLVLCEVGTKPAKINLFYNAEREALENKSVNFTLLNKAQVFLKSLASGESAQILGISEPLPGGLRHFLIAYDNIIGESGTGFIDERSSLYVLESKVTETEIRAFKNKKMACVIGGYRIP